MFFLTFQLMIFSALGVWYIIVASAPAYISEYLPPESAATATVILSNFIVAVGYLVIIYFVWKQKKLALLASIGWNLLWLIFISITFVYAKSLLSAPDYSDFIWYPTNVLLIIFSVMAYRSLRKYTPQN